LISQAEFFDEKHRLKSQTRTVTCRTCLGKNSPALIHMTGKGQVT